MIWVKGKYGSDKYHCYPSKEHYIALCKIIMPKYGTIIGDVLKKESDEICEDCWKAQLHPLTDFETA